MRSFACAATVIASLALASIVAAQAPTQGPATTTPPAASVPPPSADAEPPAGPAAKPFAGATGYSYGAVAAPASSPKTSRPHGRTAHATATGTDAIMPGFETLGDGSTRLFVELTKPVAFDTKAGRTALTYVLRGVRVDLRNNTNPLVTVHFNTPVLSARLVPHGQDVWFVVELRANASPTATMDAKGDGAAATLHVAFPKGDYLPKESGDPAPRKASEPTVTPDQ
jgi:hypothetical protein